MAKKKYSPKPHKNEIFSNIYTPEMFYSLLQEQGKIRIPGLGDFSIKHIKSREGWNPGTKAKMTIPAYVKVHFKADPRFTKFFN